MPRGSEYFNSGKFFIADSKGKDISFGHWFFHPTLDTTKNVAGKPYYSPDADEFAAKCQKDISYDLPKLAAEITRLELFLARIMRNAAIVKE